MKRTITTIGLIATALFAFGQKKSYLIASYAFSNNTNDASQQASHGTIVNSSGIQYTKDRFGNANSALLFLSEAGGYIDCGNPNIYNNFDNGLTITLWIKDTVATVPVVKDPCKECVVTDPIKPKSASLRTEGYQHILSKGLWMSGTETAFAFCISANRPYALLNINQAPVIKDEKALTRTEGATFSEVFTNSATFDGINDKAWHQLAMTWSTTGVAKFYLDGALVQTVTNVTTNMNNTSAANLFIGKSADSGFNFTGALDDITIHNIAKTDEEVLNDFNTAKPTGIENELFGKTELLAYPNPAKDVLHVSGSAEIFDLVGNKVAVGTNEINIEHLLSGIYVVKANGKSQKIVKE